MNPQAQARRVLAVTALLLLTGGACAGSEAGVTWEQLHTGDARLSETGLHLEQAAGAARITIVGTFGRARIDYTPARVDLVTQSRHRDEARSAGEVTVRWEASDAWTWIGGVGGYRGFTDFRSIWLHEYHRQLFEVVPGYVAVQPRGTHVLAGTRWSHVPGSAILQATLVGQDDRVSPGYEPRIGGPLLRGRDRLRTGGLRLGSEHVLTRRIRSLVEAGVTDTTGRPPRYSGQASLNWAAADAIVLRLVLAAVTERPAFHATSAALTVEHDWANRWFAGLTLRGYRDSGEVLDPLLVSTAAPALRSSHLALSLRHQGERASVRLEAGPYQTRYDNVPAASAQFSRFYSRRDWVRSHLAVTWRL